MYNKYLNILATVTLNNRKYILNLFDSAGQVNKENICEFYNSLLKNSFRKNMINFV